MKELLKIIPKMMPKRATGGDVEWHAAWARKNVQTDYLLTSLKSPRHHAYSVFSNCKHVPYWRDKITRGTGFPNSGDDPKSDEDDFGEWAGHIAANWPGPATDSYGCFDPTNFQSHFLTAENPPYTGRRKPWPRSPDFKDVNESYWKFDFVGFGEFFHESKCLLFYRIGTWIERYQHQYDTTGHHGNGTDEGAYSKAVPKFPQIQSYLETCTCDVQTNQTNDGMKDEHVVYIAKGKRASLRDLPSATLSTVEKITSLDMELFRVALGQFLAEIKWLEGELRQRVLCDSSLDRWEEELRYLGLSLRDRYNRA